MSAEGGSKCITETNFTKIGGIVYENGQGIKLESFEKDQWMKRDSRV
jgi:hypothetical protein